MTTIRQLSSVDHVFPGDQIPIYRPDKGDTRKMTATVLADFVLASSPRQRILSPSIIGAPLQADEVFLAVTPPANETWEFPANLEGAGGLKLSGGVNPASPYTIRLNKNGVQVASIVIGTSGTVSFSTSLLFTIMGGQDELQMVGDAVPSAAVGYAFSIPFFYIEA